MTNKEWIRRVLQHDAQVPVPYNLPLSPLARQRLEEHYGTGDVEAHLDLPIRMSGPLALATMLTDSRPAHRISALWVARTLRYAPAADLLNRLATGDPDPKVRARAATALAELQEAATQGAATQEAVT